MDAAQRSVMLGYDVWQYQGVAMLMFAPAWLAASRLSAAWRQPLARMALFNLLEGTGLALVGLRGQAPDLLTYLAANLIMVVAYVVVWRMVCRLAGQADRRAECIAVLAIMVPTLALTYAVLGPPATAGVTLVCAGGVALRGSQQAVQRLRLLGEHRLALAVLLCMGPFSLGLLAEGVVELWPLPHPGELHGRQAFVALASLPALFGMNLIVAYYVFGRSLVTLARIGAPMARPGLGQHGDAALVLAAEAAAHVSAGRRLVMAALRIDRFEHWQREWGATTSEAVLAEVAAHISGLLGPMDSMGPVRDGAFLICLPGADGPAAAARLRRAQQAVANDAGLHPDGGPPLRLRSGMVIVEPLDDMATVIDIVLWRSLHEPLDPALAAARGAT